MWYAEAPSNIALIKYMGKNDGNLPCNTSLSFTLDNLISRVEMYEIDDDQDRFEPLEMVGFLKLDISNISINKFKKHIGFLKNKFHCKNKFLIKSGNNFPNDVGIASSASSFAALTKCAIKAFRDLGYCSEINDIQASALSRIGSGSSCRSFFSPWAIWRKEYAEKIDLPMTDLIHNLCLVDDSPKKISSSAAHAMVQTSLLFEDRNRRAEIRVEKLIKAIKSNDWEKMFKLSWADFMDMHALFETCSKPFGYMNQETIKILGIVRDIWAQNSDGPIVTVDAGPNVHLLWRQDQQDLISEFEILSCCEIIR